MTIFTCGNCGELVIVEDERTIKRYLCEGCCYRCSRIIGKKKDMKILNMMTLRRATPQKMVGLVKAILDGSAGYQRLDRRN